MAVGLSVLVGSRGPLIGILLAFYLAVQPLLVGIGFLGDVRQVIPEAALHRIGDVTPPGGVEVSLVVAIVGLLGWAAVALVLGAWRTNTREI
jgi:hypothetical protein